MRARTMSWAAVAGVVASMIWSVPASYALDGEPVAGFGSGGVLLDAAVGDGRQVAVTDAADSPNKGTVITGWISLGPAIPSQRGFIVRYDRLGKRDASFGTDGVVLFPDFVATQPAAVAVQPDGSSFVGGAGGLVRVSSAGLLDQSFNGSSFGDVVQLVPEPDDAVVVVSVAVSTNGRSIVARRVAPNGVSDAGYSGDISSVVGGQAFFPASASRAPNGNVVIAGRLSNSNPTCVVISLTQMGVPDSSFGNGGLVNLGPASSIECRADVEPDGYVLVTTPTVPLAADTPVVRLAPDGSVFDPSFLVLPSAATALTVEGHDRIVTGGLDSAGAFSVKVRAFDFDGTPSADFGGSGPDGNQYDLHTIASVDDVEALETGDIVVYGSTTAPGSTSPSSVIFLTRLSSPWGVAPQPPLVETTRFEPLTPNRILDTRIGLGAAAAKVGPGGTVDLQITGVGGVPANDVAAVVLNVTATESGGPGFVAVYPSGGARPVVSNLNIERAGETVANSVTVSVGESGKVSLFTLSGGHLVADVAGYYDYAAASTAGRFVGSPAPTRLLDTRIGQGAPLGVVGAGQSIDLQILGNTVVPTAGVSSVVLNVTATESVADGFITVWPQGIVRPTVSSLNVVAGETRANLVIVPVGTSGQVSLFSQSGAHLIADVAGWFTNASSPLGVDGLFVPIQPTRILDTRRQSVTPLPAQFFLGRTIGGTSTVPPDFAGAVVLNLTTTDAAAPGFVSVSTNPSALQVASNLNVSRPGQIVPNAAIVRMAFDRLFFYLQSGGHIIADIAGWYVQT